jgi:hypothetical protein
MSLLLVHSLAASAHRTRYSYTSVLDDSAYTTSEASFLDFDVDAEDDQSLREAGSTNIVSHLPNDDEDAVPDFLLAIGQLRTLADYVTDEDAAAAMHWLGPVLSGSTNRRAELKTHTVGILLFGRGDTQEATDKFIAHMRRVQQLADATHSGNVEVILDWMSRRLVSDEAEDEAVASVHNTQRLDFHTSSLEDASRPQIATGRPRWQRCASRSFRSHMATEVYQKE